VLRYRSPVSGGLAGLENWSGKKELGVSATIFFASSMAPFMPLDPWVSKRVARRCFKSCRLSILMVSGMVKINFNPYAVKAKNNMKKWELSNHFNISKGDIRTFDIKDYGPFDLITLYNIIYYFEPEERSDLIKNYLKIQVFIKLKQHKLCRVVHFIPYSYPDCP
jgi:hypothetical protein